MGVNLVAPQSLRGTIWDRQFTACCVTLRGVSEPRVVFGTSFESLFTPELRAKLTPAFEADLRALGIDVHKGFNPAYPVEQWVKVCEVCLRHAWAGRPPDEAWFELGRGIIRGFQNTLVGAAAFKLLRLIGPARALERSTRVYASSSNYMKIELSKRGTNSYTARMNELHTPPQLDMGIFHESLVALGAKPTLTVVEKDATGFTLGLDW